MARLFLTPREIDFISDITKELTKDVRGQKIFYYGVREDLSQVHDIYEQPVISTNKFGSETLSKIAFYAHTRDLLDRDITVKVGDYFSYGQEFYEITSVIIEKQVYGQIEHQVGKKVTGVQARRGLIDRAANGPTSEEDLDAGVIQTVFDQQRGYEQNTLGPTEDKRQLVEDGKLDPGLTGPKIVKEQQGEKTSYFYGDD
ncbi:MAG: hypothetical protein EBZ49_03215 [Proteobacteria bacterium]|nr:hypothetical protein [Pseudomonadota bacterium]